MLPVPERGRGPGQSALQDAGLPEARGHPGAAQPVGEEDRAAQIRVGPRQATKGTHRRERGVHRHLAQGHLGKVAGWGSRNHRGGLPARALATLAGQSSDPSLSMALSPTGGRATLWCPVPSQACTHITASGGTLTGQAPSSGFTFGYRSLSARPTHWSEA